MSKYCKEHKTSHYKGCPWCRIRELEFDVKALGVSLNESLNTVSTQANRIDELEGAVRSLASIAYMEYPDEEEAALLDFGLERPTEAMEG